MRWRERGGKRRAHVLRVRGQADDVHSSRSCAFGASSTRDLTQSMSDILVSCQSWSGSAHKLQLLNPRKGCKPVVKQSHYLKLYKLTIRCVTLRTKVIKTENASPLIIWLHFTAIHTLEVLCLQSTCGRTQYMRVSCCCSLLPNSLFSDGSVVTRSQPR